MTGRKVVFFRSSEVPVLPPWFMAIRYETRRKQNWHYECAAALAAGRLAVTT